MPLTFAISGSGGVWAVAVSPPARVAAAASATSASRRGAQKAETDRWVIGISLSVEAAGAAGPILRRTLAQPGANRNGWAPLYFQPGRECGVRLAAPRGARAGRLTRVGPPPISRQTRRFPVRPSRLTLA